MVVRTIDLDVRTMNAYDKTFNDHIGRVTAIKKTKDGSIIAKVVFFPGQRRRWGLIAPGFLKPDDSVLDVIVRAVSK
jgi:hypothetical protein